MKIIGQSKAIHSTWFYLPTFKLLLDCGEGASFHLGSETGDVQHIFLSHMHLDHWSGLLPIARYQKRVGFKDERKGKAIVYYHKDFKKDVDNIRSFFESKQMRLFLNFVEVKEGNHVHLRDNFYIEPFLVDHQQKYYKHKMTAMGMHLLEKRRRLVPSLLKKKAALDKKYGAKEGQEHFRKYMIEQKKKKGEDSLHEEYFHKLLSYCGDSRPIDPKIVAGTEILMHESTFMNADEVDSAHSALPEVLKTAKKSKCEKLVLYHFSDRYRQEGLNYEEEVKKQAKKINLDIPIHIVQVNKLFAKEV